MLVGYARCSSDAQDPTAHRDALSAHGVTPDPLLPEGMSFRRVCVYHLLWFEACCGFRRDPPSGLNPSCFRPRFATWSMRLFDPLSRGRRPRSPPGVPPQRGFSHRKPDDPPPRSVTENIDRCVLKTAWPNIETTTDPDSPRNPVGPPIPSPPPDHASVVPSKSNKLSKAGGVCPRWARSSGPSPPPAG